MTVAALGAAALAALYCALRAYAFRHNARRVPRDAARDAALAVCRAHAARFALLGLWPGAGAPLTLDWRLVDVPCCAASWRTQVARARRGGTARLVDGRWRYESAQTRRTSKARAHQ